VGWCGLNGVDGWLEWKERGFF